MSTLLNINWKQYLLTMEEKMKRQTKIVTLVTVLVLTQLITITFAQEDKVSKLTPISDEAYNTLIWFFDYDTSLPLNSRVLNKKEGSIYNLEKIVFTGLRDTRVPGYLAIPKAGTAPYPCVLLLHGYGSSGGSWWENESDDGPFAAPKAILSKGFAVLTLDAKYHGERVSDNDYEPPGDLESSSYRDLIVESVIEYRRAIEYLSTRSDIDSKRIGIWGYSMGGLMAHILLAVEPHIKVSVNCVCPPIIKNIGLFNERTDLLAPYQYIRGINNRPILMLMASKDEYYTVDEGEKLYNLIKGKNKKLIWYDSGHFMPQEHVHEAAGWFIKYLK